MYVPFGKITKAFGIRGALRIDLYNRDSTLLAAGKSILLKPHPLSRNVDPMAQNQEFLIKSIQRMRQKGALVLYLQGLDSRTEAELFTGFEIHLKRDDFGGLAENEFFLVDLVGLAVANEHGERWGTLVSIMSNGPQSVATVQVGEKENLQDDLLVPLVAPFFLGVDFNAGVVLLQKPELV